MMSNFAQKISVADMTEQRLHLNVLKDLLLDIKLAARYPTDDTLQTIKDVNAITTPGLYKLTQDSRNYEEPIKYTYNTKYEPLKDTTGLPHLGISLLHVIPLTDTYIRQYVLVASGGKTSINTRLGTKANNKVNWGKWRPYSDDNPFYEMINSLTYARVNTNYLNFGNNSLELPDPVICKLGDVIRLDQWKGKGSVTCDDQNVSTVPVTTDVYTKLKCSWKDERTNPITEISIKLQKDTEYTWVDGSYQVIPRLVSDTFYWSIVSNEGELFRSNQTIFEVPSPENATYVNMIQRLTSLHWEVISEDISDENILACNTYEFEIFNDTDVSDPTYNYWCLFQSNKVRNASLKTRPVIEQSFENMLQKITSVHSRITETSTTLTSYITLVSEQLTSYIDTSISDHDVNPDAHSEIITSIIATQTLMQDDITSIRADIEELKPTASTNNPSL